jgi:hypothetical protein
MTEESIKPVRRHDRDLARGIVPEGTRMAGSRTTDALQPVLEAIQILGAFIDRVADRVEANHRAEAKSEKRLAALREYLQRPITADMLQTDGCRRPWRLRSTFRDESYSQ